MAALLSNAGFPVPIALISILYQRRWRMQGTADFALVWFADQPSMRDIRTADEADFSVF
jgi:hypothetical protein